MPIEIMVKQADLADTLAAMREWLDRERCVLSHFCHTGDGAGFVVIYANVADRTCAEIFRQIFD